MMNELVHTHMTKDVITLGPDNTLGEAREIMLKKRIHHLPILDGKTLVGMVTSWDFFKLGKSAEEYQSMPLKEIMTTKIATLDPDRADALLEGYDAHRPLTDLEREMWPVMLRRAALRTWLGRLEYNHFPKASEMTIPKDHDFSRRLLEHHIVHARALEVAGD